VNIASIILDVNFVSMQTAMVGTLRVDLSAEELEDLFVELKDVVFDSHLVWMDLPILWEFLCKYLEDVEEEAEKVVTEILDVNFAF